MNDGVNHRKIRLSRRQLELLKLIYSRRFITTKQVQRQLGMTQTQQAQQRLNTLLNKGYIGRRYSSQDKLLGRYATYFLLSAGIALLQNARYGSRYALRLMKKDASASPRFMQHCLAVGDVSADLLRLYPEPTFQTDFMTKTESLKHDSDYDYGSGEVWTDGYPKPQPDGYFATFSDKDVSSFVEVWHETVPFWVYRKRLQYYVDFFFENDWKTVIDGNQLVVLLVCDTPTLQRRVQRHLQRSAESLYTDDLKFLVTHQELLASAKMNAPIWTTVDEERADAVRLMDAAVD